MVIVHVALAIIYGGGVGSVVKNLILEQTKMGHKTVLVSLDDENSVQSWFEENKLNTQFYPVTQKLRKKYPTVFGLLSKKTRKEIQKTFLGEKIVFHFHNPIAYGLLNSNKKIRKICTMHGQINLKGVASLLFCATIKKFIKNNGTLVGCSEYIAEYYRKAFKCPSIVSVVNGTGIIEKQENKYVKDNNKYHIAFVGCIDELKGWRYLANGYANLCKEVKEKSDLYFVGKIAESDIDDFNKILENEPNINYVGYVDDVQQSFLPYVDLLVLPSRTEGLPMVLLEAMMNGVVCLSTPVGGIPEIIYNGENGLFIKRDAVDICEKIEQLLKNDSEIKKYKKESKKKFEEKGTAERMCKDYLIVYNAQ